MNTDKHFRSSSQPIRTSLKNDAIIFTANHIKLLQNYWVTFSFLPSVMTALASCGTPPRQYSSFTSPMPSRRHLAHHSSRFSLWQTFHLEEYSSPLFAAVTSRHSVPGVLLQYSFDRLRYHTQCTYRHFLNLCGLLQQLQRFFSHFRWYILSQCSSLILPPSASPARRSLFTAPRET
jgi:hypothetical protein